MDGGGGGGLGGIFEDRAMEQSFKEFLNRPENRPKVEAYQRSEIKKNLKMTEKMRTVEFRDKVLASEFESQKAIQPFLKYPVLRKVVQTLTNDPRNDFDVWASNPRVISMLKDAKKLLDEGRITEAEMEHMFLAQYTNPKHEAYEDFKAKTEQVARLSTEQLVGALNEHLEERQKGNDLYRAGNYTAAMIHYERALSIVKVVRGMATSDQIEVLKNRQAVLRNIAAVHLATGHFGAAIECCTEAIEISSGKDVKGLLRRARAYTFRHEYELAQDDLEVVKSLEPWNYEAADQSRRLAQLKAQGKRQEQSSFSGMFSFG